MQEVSDWLLEWFRQRGTVTRPDQLSDLRLNYFEARLIDSMGVIELIADVEEHWDIAFDQDDFQDRRFPTILGLSEIVTERRNGRVHG